MSTWALTEWLSWIEAQHPKNIDLSLERVRQVGLRLSVMRFPCPVVIVAGTNGKGSCVATMQSILLAQGLRVASYTSPHLLRFNERIVINGLPVDDVLLCDAFSVVREAAGQCVLTFFEFTTLAALWIFQNFCQREESRLDIILLEIGLGGRLDAVNVVEPDVTVITSVDFDHMDYLGDTREAIATEKAGIIREHVPLICGDRDLPQAILHIAIQKNAPLFQLGHDFDFSASNGTWNWQSIKKSLITLPQPVCLLENAAIALMALHCLPVALRPNANSIKQGLQSLYIAGRQQWILGKPLQLLDVAHNPQATAKLAQQLPHDKRLLAVVAMLADKAHANCLAPFVDRVDQWFLASLTETPRAGTAAQLQNALLTLTDKVNSQCFETVSAAYQCACSRALPDDLIVVFGSFHTVAAVLVYNKVVSP
jgi:dihydrofolate synthase / folylpolyglutamate synthase